MPNRITSTITYALTSYKNIVSAIIMCINYMKSFTFFKRNILRDVITK